MLTKLVWVAEMHQLYLFDLGWYVFCSCLLLGRRNPGGSIGLTVFFFTSIEGEKMPVLHVSGIKFIELDDGKIYRKALYLMVKTMVSCRL